MKNITFVYISIVYRFDMFCCMSCSVCDFHISYFKGIKAGYSCLVCDKTFSHKSSLARQMRSHNKDDGHKCLICYKLYTTTLELNEHINSVHTK